MQTKKTNIRSFFSEMDMFNIAGIARLMGKDRSWLSRRINGTKQFKHEDLLRLQKIINAIGVQMTKIKFTNSGSRQTDIKDGKNVSSKGNDISNWI